MVSLADDLPVHSFEGSKAGEERGNFCWCPPGTFAMGFEGTRVTLSKGFWMGKYPVTQEQYRPVMGHNPSGFLGAQLPVESVEKVQATDFCVRLTTVEQKNGTLPSGWQYRLPTEAQWEYAARAGTDAQFPWGDDAKLQEDYVWNRVNSGMKTHPVGQKKPNPWGICDILGHVLEWCQDCWLQTYPGGNDPEVTKKDLPVRPGESPAPFGVSRCSGWAFPPNMTPRHRNRLGSGDSGYLLGFRVAIVQSSVQLNQR
jgi:formylglycine-generating enzyme required for sulfatase activity